MQFLWIAVAILATWRVTHLLAAEDGPWEMIAKLRRWIGIDCFYCLSLWTAPVFAYLVGTGWKEWLLLWPAISAGAILIERLVSKEPAAAYYEEEEHGVLREREDEFQSQRSRIPRP
jgi:hypothetical protein